MLPPGCRESCGPVEPTSREAWSRAAENYIAHCRREVNWNKMIEIPALRRMVGPVAGKRTLEAGCGGAHYSLWLAQQGATAAGFDPAGELIAQARADAEAAGVTLDLRVGGLELLADYPEAHFDLVLFPMMLEYVDDLEAAFCAAARVLRPEGFVALSIVHPMRHFSWKVDLPEGQRLRVVSGYLQRRVIEWTGWVMGDAWCRSHLRPIEDYVKALVGAGFLIEALEEPMAVDDCRELAPRIYQSNLDCPQFLLIRAVKDPRERARAEVAGG